VTNTPDAYESFLKRYPFSDQTTTANRLHVNPRPVAIDPVIAPRNFPFPRFPSQFGNNQPGGGQGGGPFKGPGFPGQGGQGGQGSPGGGLGSPVVTLPGGQNQTPGKPGGLGTPGGPGNTTINPGNIVHLPPGTGIITTPGKPLDTKIITTTPITTPGTPGKPLDTKVIHLPAGPITTTPITPGGKPLDTKITTTTPLTTPGRPLDTKITTTTPLTTPGKPLESNVVRLPGQTGITTTTAPKVLNLPGKTAVTSPTPIITGKPSIEAHLPTVNASPVLNNTRLRTFNQESNLGALRNPGGSNNFTPVQRVSPSLGVGGGTTTFQRSFNSGGGGGGGGGGAFNRR
jgi:hypothetical protein